MTEKARAELLADVLSRYEGSPNPRLREITEAAIRHLHAFAEEVNLQRDEWFAGIQFLTATGQKCDDNRQEFILLSDTLGVSSLVEMLTHDGIEGSTENTVLGPFYVPGLPDACQGRVDARRSRRRRPGRDPGHRHGHRHEPIAGATLDCWQNSTAGFYAVQQPDEQSPENLRGIYTTDADGSYEIRTVRPVPYPIPSDGPAGDLLKAHGRNWMRAGHTHMWVRADGYKELITHVFDEETELPARGRGVRRAGQPHPAASSRTPPASWRRRSTSCSTAPEARAAAMVEAIMASDAVSAPRGVADDGSEPTLLYLVGRIDRVVRRAIGTVLEAQGLSVNQYTTLSVLDRRSGLSNAQLARRALVSPAVDERGAPRAGGTGARSPPRPSGPRSDPPGSPHRPRAGRCWRAATRRCTRSRPGW